MVSLEKAEPVAVPGELKAHLRVEGELEDALLSAWLRAATEAVETELGLLLLERAVVETVTVNSGMARASLAPLRAVEGVDVKDASGDWQPLVATEYSTVLEGDQAARILFASLSDRTEARVRYRAGLAAERNSLPEILRQAVIRLAAHWYANRDSAEAPGMTPAVRQMLSPLRRRRLR